MTLVHSEETTCGPSLAPQTNSTQAYVNITCHVIYILCTLFILSAKTTSHYANRGYLAWTCLVFWCGAMLGSSVARCGPVLRRVNCFQRQSEVNKKYEQI